ncbi:MAG TPA: prepilin peptidase [Rhizomicrobium sp.]|jgi:prepilin peptidase CpaA|nr:prepilin peptidase [Rhizomicrobium sp.]
MIAQTLLLVIFPLLLVLAAGWDLSSFTIPNTISICLIAAFAAFAMAAGMAPAVIGWHLLAGFIALAASFTLFALGYFGGGDAKLFAAIALWLGFNSLLPYTLLVAIAGGALALTLLLARRIPLPATLASHSWISHLHDSKSGIPYGIALSAGALILLPQTELFRLAAGG